MTESDEVRLLGAALADIDQLLPGPRRPGTVAIVDGRADEGDTLEGTLRALRMAVAVREIGRRMPEHSLRSFSRASLPQCGLAGELIEPLPGPGAEAGLTGLRDEADCVVALDGDPGAYDPPALQLGDGDIPDLLVLARRVASDTLMESRREYLAVTGRIPADSRYVLCLPEDSAGDELDKLAQDLAVVVRPDPPPNPVDLLGLIWSAAAVVTSSAAVAAAAASLGRPVVLEPFSKAADWAGHLGAGDLEDLPGLVDVAPDADPGTTVMDQLDRRLDELCLRIERCPAPTVTRTTVDGVGALAGRLSALEAAYAGLLDVLLRERTVMAREIRRRDAERVQPDEPSPATLMAHRLAVEQQAVAELREEIKKIYSTRTMRMTAPVRQAYGRLRRLLK
jgi:hypothetical protein